MLQVYQDCCKQTVDRPYLVHKLTSQATGLQFCPYEDVLGVGHGTGFSSLIIPGNWICCTIIRVSDNQEANY